MLERLLELLRTGGTHLVTDLAHEIGTTPVLVEVMLEDLGRMGYLKQVGGKCGGECGGCSLAGLCSAGSSGQVWTLTEKSWQRTRWSSERAGAANALEQRTLVDNRHPSAKLIEIN